MESSRAPTLPQELRKTCDHCRKRKIKCSNENPCVRCHRFGLSCRYSPTRPLGRPSKRRETRPSDLNRGAGQDSSTTICRNGLAMFEGLQIPEDLNDAMTLDASSSLTDFLTPPEEFSWSEFDTMMSAAYPINATSQNQAIPSPVEESREAGCVSEVDGTSQSHNNTDLNIQCQCGDLVRKHMNNRTNTHDLWEFVMRQRKSVELAQKILDCNNCGSPDNLPSQVSGNVLLFGAIMMDATSSCQSFIKDLKQRALVPADEQHDIQIYLASKEPNGHHIEYQVERQYVWPLAKVLLRVETDKLNRICIAFITRQWRVHEKGHEICLAGATCKKPKTTQTCSPADFCPRSIEPTSFFSCFRTAKHLQSAISNIQKDLE